MINSKISIAQDSINELKIKEYFQKLPEIQDDKSKLDLNQKIDSILFCILKNDNSFDYAFDSLKNMGKLTSKDNLIRVITWNIPLKDGTHKYFGYIQYQNKIEKQFEIYKLTDNDYKESNIDTFALKPCNWYGALYYDIIETKHNKTKYYTLLGFDFNSIFTKKKVIDILYLNNNEPYFGKPIFNYNNEMVSRIFFEYSVRANMALQYNSNLKMIVFDHLSPSKPSYKGKYQFYGPDFSYDGLKFEDGRWNHYKDLNIHN